MYKHLSRPFWETRPFFAVSASRSIALVMLTALLMLYAQPSDSQNAAPIVLSFAPLNAMPDLNDSDLFDDFEAAHPGVEVVVVEPSPYLESPVFDVNAHLNRAKDQMSKADVVAVDQSRLTSFMTRAGLVLDLQPLASADAALDPADFYAPAWDSYRWDGGMWALPLAVSGVLLAYDKSAFDAAELEYPTTDWTFDDFAAAAHALTVRDENGAITSPGFQYSAYAMSVLYSLSSPPGLIAPDGSANFSDPALAELGAAWATLVKEGVITDFSRTTTTRQPPMFLTESIYFYDDSTVDFVPLPGGHMPLSMKGLAISSGTTHPELAYELAKYLTQSPIIANRHYGFAARRSVAHQPISAGETTGAGVVYNLFLDEYVAYFESLLDRALPTSELRYSDYLFRALWDVETIGAKLFEYETKIRDDLAAAEAFRESPAANLVIVEPTLIPRFDDGRVTLRFALQLTSPQFGIRTLAHEDRFREFAAEFIEGHPRIGAIDLVFVENTTSWEQLTGSYDCFYIDDNVVPDADLTTLISIDPLMNADTDFAPDAVFGDTLTQLSRDNHIWGYPLTIHPALLRINPRVFENADVTLPIGADVWDVNAFNDAMQTLWVANSEAYPAMAPRQFSAMHILMLIAAYGGLPFDYRVSPPAINFTEPSTVAAIQQVLDLARQGSLHYIPLGPGYSVSLSSGIWPIQSDIFGAAAATNQLGYALTSYPVGSTYTPVAYAIGTGYISAETPNIETCYEWIKTLAKRPDLLDGFPASSAVPDYDIITAQFGQGAAEFFERFVGQLDSLNRVVIPFYQDYGERRWLASAFDRYVLEDADLLTELEKAEALTHEYRECRVASPELTSFECGEKVALD